MTNTAKKIGKFLAHTQAFVDDLLGWAFFSLKKAGEKKENENLPGGRVKSTLRKAAGFFGEMGESFFEKYEDIKAKKKKP